MQSKYNIKKAIVAFMLLFAGVKSTMAVPPTNPRIMGTIYVKRSDDSPNGAMEGATKLKEYIFRRSQGRLKFNRIKLVDQFPIPEENLPVCGFFGAREALCTEGNRPAFPEFHPVISTNGLYYTDYTGRPVLAMQQAVYLKNGVIISEQLKALFPPIEGYIIDSKRWYIAVDAALKLAESKVDKPTLYKARDQKYSKHDFTPSLEKTFKVLLNGPIMIYIILGVANDTIRNSHSKLTWELPTEDWAEADLSKSTIGESWVKVSCYKCLYLPGPKGQKAQLRHPPTTSINGKEESEEEEFGKALVKVIEELKEVFCGKFEYREHFRGSPPTGKIIKPNLF